MDSSPAFRPLRSTWLAGWSYTAGKLTLSLTKGGELEADVPPWIPGLLTLAKSPGEFFARHIKPLGVRSVPAPNPPEPDLTGVLEASIAIERRQRHGGPFSAAVDAYRRQFTEIAARQTEMLERAGREVAP